MSRQSIPRPSTEANSTDEQSTDQSLTRTEIFDMLSNRRRRYILHYLKQREESGPASLRDVVDQVAAWESDTTVEQLDSAERKRVYTALRQSHLPKLHDTGVVEYDNKRGDVELTDDAREVEVYLEYVPENDISWSQYYLALSGISSGIIFATVFEISMFADIPALPLTALIISLFFISSAVHAYHSWQTRLGAGTLPSDYISNDR